MVTLHPEFVFDEQQHRKAVLLPVAEWDQIVDELEELDDIRAYDAAKAGTTGSTGPAGSPPNYRGDRDLGGRPPATEQ